MSEVTIVDLSNEADTIDHNRESALLVARLLSDLSVRGVVPKITSVTDYFESHGGDTKVTIFDAVVNWLLAEGVVREAGQRLSDDEDATVTYYELVLTSFGFHVLDRKLLNGFTLREQIGLAVNKSSQDHSKWGDAVGGILAGFTKAMASG